MDDQGLRFGSVVGMLRRRLRPILFGTGAVLLAAILLAAWLPNQYIAGATLLVEPQTISKKLVEAGLEESDLNDRLHLMTMQILSRQRLSRIIDDLKLYPEESEDMTREEVIGLMKAKIRVDPVLPRLEERLPQLQRRAEIEINTFTLSFENESPTVAAAVANRLANDFIDEHIKERVAISGETAEFIEGELDRLGQRIREVEAQIAQVKAENAGSLPDDMFTNQRQLENSIDNLRLAQQKLAEAESDQVYYSQQALAAAQGTSLDPRESTSPATRLQIVQVELTSLRARGLTDKHPDVVAALAEIEQIKAQIETSGEGDLTAHSPAQQNAEAEARRAALRVESGKQELERLQVEITQSQQRLAATPRVAEQLDGLDREYKHLTASFLDYSNKRLESSVAANMERRQKGEQFKVLEAAFPPPEPNSPNRPLVIFLGLLLGVAVGGGLAIVFEGSDTSYHDPRSLQSSLRIPVLASIPGILLDADRRRIRQRRVREVLVAAALTFLVLTGAAAGFVYRSFPDLFGGGEAAAPIPGAPAPGAPAAPAAPIAPAPAAPAAAQGG